VKWHSAKARILVQADGALTSLCEEYRVERLITKIQPELTPKVLKAKGGGMCKD